MCYNKDDLPDKNKKYKEGINMKTKAELPACSVATGVALIGGKWKLLPIIDALADFGNYYKSAVG